LHGSASIVGGLRTIATGAAAAGAAITAAAAASATLAFKLAADAAPMESIEAAYRGITGGGEEMLAMLRQQSAGMITNRALMTSYNLAAQLVNKTFADQLPDAMGYLTKVAAATDQDMDYMMNSLVRGVGRLSPLILDNLGIQVDLTEACETYAASIDKTVGELSKEEQQTAVMNQVMEKLAANTASMPDVTGTASRGLASLSTWFKNLKDDVGLAFLPALKELMSFLNMLAPLISSTVLPALHDLGGWIADITRQWTQGIASLIAKAAAWGANVVESFAGGISGSDAIVRALRNVATTITTWLAPGSPPKLLPDLTKWGLGAAQAWLDGWSVETLVQSKFLQNLRTGLRPLLEEIDLGKEIDPKRLEKMFGLGAPDVDAYLKAYRNLGTATRAVADAREELARAEESGDEDAIKAAREKLGLAEKDETRARRAFYVAEDQMARRIAAEVQLAKAIEKKAQVEARAAEDSARLAAEAEQRLIAQAYLQYRLAVAGTAAAQIPIWQEELAKVTEGSADYWNIMTRLVELQRQVAAGGGGGGGGGDGGIGAAADELGRAADGAKKTVEKIDWKGIGGAMIDALIDGMVTQIKLIPEKLVELSAQVLAWAQLPETQTKLHQAGYDATKFIIDGMIDLILSAMGADLAGDTLASQMGTVISNLEATFEAIGSGIAVGLLAGFLSYFTSDEEAYRLAEAIWTTFKKSLTYITPTGRAKLLWETLTGGAEKLGTAIGEALVASEAPLDKAIVEFMQSPLPEWLQPGYGTEAGKGGTQVKFERGAIEVNASGRDPDEVGRAVETGVLKALRAAGVS